MPYPLDRTTLKLRKESLDRCLNALNLKDQLQTNVQTILSTIEISTYSSSFFADKEINSKIKAAITALTRMKNGLPSEEDVKKLDQLIAYLEQPTEEITKKDVVEEWQGLNFSSGED